MLEVNRNENIEVICNAEVTKVDGYVGSYEITIEKQPWFTTP